MAAREAHRWWFACGVALFVTFGAACSDGDVSSALGAAASSNTAAATSTKASVASSVSSLPTTTSATSTTSTSGIPSSSMLPSSVPGRTGVPGAPPGLAVGDCLPNGFVDVETPFVAAETVDCSEDHMGEVVGIVALDAASGFPGVGLVSQRADQLCIEAFTEELGIEFRSSPLSLAPVFPTEASWDEGDRAVLCVVTFADPEQRPIADFDDDETQLPDGQVFSFLLAPGDCFADDALLVAPIVPVVACEMPHQFELYGAIDLPNGAFPTVETLDNLADGVCFEEFERYTGQTFADSDLLYRFLYPSEASWEAGDRKVLCFVDAGEEVAESAAAPATDDAEE